METVSIQRGVPLAPRFGHTIPYGALSGASDEVRVAYYYYGWRDDAELPELPVAEPEEPTANLEARVFLNELPLAVDTILASLTKREETVLRMRFGLGVHADMTLEDIGRALGVTRERIRQIEAKALRKLRHRGRREDWIKIGVSVPHLVPDIYSSQQTQGRK